MRSFHPQSLPLKWLFKITKTGLSDEYDKIIYGPVFQVVLVLLPVVILTFYLHVTTAMEY